jgi:hypothetical protein
MNPRVSAIALAISTGALLFSSASQAALVAQWDLSGQAGNQVSSTALVLASGITGGLMSRGAGLTGSAAGNSFSSTGWNGQSTDYLSLTLNVAAGSSLDLQTLSVGTRSSNTGLGSIGLFYSGDGFTTAITTIAQPGTNFVNSAIDLTALADVTGALEFRFYQIGTTAAGGGTSTAAGTFRLTDYFNGATDENLSLTGTLSTASAVPLPAAAWLLVAGLGAMGAAVRRQRAAAGSTAS